MAQPHASSNQVVSLLPLGEQLGSARTTALLKAQQLEAMRIVLRAGHGVPEHKTPGEITVQCLEGDVEFRASDALHVLRGGDWRSEPAGQFTAQGQGRLPTELA